MATDSRSSLTTLSIAARLKRTGLEMRFVVDGANDREVTDGQTARLPSRSETAVPRNAAIETFGRGAPEFVSVSVERNPRVGAAKPWKQQRNSDDKKPKALAISET